jgi:hypothetical protein
MHRKGDSLARDRRGASIMDETGKPTKHTRRAALRTWLTGSASLTLLAVAGALPIRSILAAPAEQAAGPAPAQVPASVRVAPRPAQR